MDALGPWPTAEHGPAGAITTGKASARSAAGAAATLTTSLSVSISRCKAAGRPMPSNSPARASRNTGSSRGGRGRARRRARRFCVEEGEWKEGPSGLRPPLDRQSLALQLVGGDERFQELVRALQNMAVYTIFPDTLRAPQKYARQAHEPARRQLDLGPRTSRARRGSTSSSRPCSADGGHVDMKVPRRRDFLSPFQHESRRRREMVQRGPGIRRHAPRGGDHHGAAQEPTVPVIWRRGAGAYGSPRRDAAPVRLSLPGTKAIAGGGHHPQPGPAGRWIPRNCVP